MQPQRILSSLRLEPAAVVGPLRFIRLLGASGELDADFLEESVPQGRTTVSEIGAEGIVGLVRVEHHGELPLLLLDGEQIVGAKQNRIVNASFLLQPGARVEVPVSCVERGRWAYRQGPAGRFDSSDTTITARARTAKLRRVSASLDGGLGYDAGQRAVWRDVDGYLDRTGTISGSDSFDDAFEGRRQRVERALDALRPVDDQVGIATTCGRALLLVEWFGSSSLYARAWKKIGRGLLAEEYGSDAATSEADALSIVAGALEVLETLETKRTPAPGGAEMIHASSQGLTLAGLAAGGSIYHAIAAGEAA